MKLYSTTTSERASKGQGGNKYLDIKIEVEHDDGVRDQLCSIEVKRIVNRDFAGQDIYEATCLAHFERKAVAAIQVIKPGDSAETTLIKMRDARKGNKQKDEQLWTCGKCGTKFPNTPHQPVCPTCHTTVD